MTYQPKSLKKQLVLIAKENKKTNQKRSGIMKTTASNSPVIWRLKTYMIGGSAAGDGKVGILVVNLIE